MVQIVSIVYCPMMNRIVCGIKSSWKWCEIHLTSRPGDARRQVGPMIDEVHGVMPQSHQTFRPVPAVKLLEIMLRNRCWPTTSQSVIAGDDANRWCQKWSMWTASHLCESGIQRIQEALKATLPTIGPHSRCVVKKLQKCPKTSTGDMPTYLKEPTQKYHKKWNEGKPIHGLL